MSRENVNFQVEERSGRITRARAKELSESGGILCSSKSSGVQKHILRANSKRMASDDIKTCSGSSHGLPNKRRAVLKDVTNISTKGFDKNCRNVSNIQGAKTTRKVSSKAKANAPSNAPEEILGAEEDANTRLAEDLSKIRVVESREVSLRETLDEKERTEQTRSLTSRECGVSDMILSVSSEESIPQPNEKYMAPQRSAALRDRGVIDIDSNSKCLQSCSTYAPDIYDRIRVTELDQRASTTYMEQLQQDITANMRGILVDWLVEVSEEYNLVSDTLYLTVNVIDRFLSQNYIEKKRLQLVGVASMLIASKYEEICAPRVEDFCFITDNTYTKGEVVEMESEVLNILHFRLSVPTTKTFLRRFIQSAHASYKVPCIELEFLANYLAELTLVEYSFLKFLPSLIAASAVFLARWTLDQSDHPWNPTLEHYTGYSVSQLKTVVLALHDLQLNTSASSLNAIRQKYKQPKFKCVATLTSTKSVLSLF
ncbi:cyclin-A2-2 [Cucumis sativus]|uniref:B-like cyclin n=1 Tax=Cucumis sativus TaxID=3659 RepID=A0A0A0LGQ2_CUCSA|nr:cyclin-A2-2 [Cucumis sativus]XP_011652496.1 cyclin-A2-2 [Cucumis sativus]